jgi:hypothetical protein
MMYPVSDIALLFWPESRAAVARAFRARSWCPSLPAHLMAYPELLVMGDGTVGVRHVAGLARNEC